MRAPVVRLRVTGVPFLGTRLLLILCAAFWGVVVDADVIPLLTPTGNSTIVQATTAAPFALLGIRFGPAAGAAAGFVRDGSGYLATVLIHPGMAAHHTIWHWAARGTADTVEDMILGWIPGIVAQRTRRLSLLALSAAVAAWISLPFLVVANTLLDGHVSQVWQALGTPIGDWDEPSDPGLYVYALLTGAFVALVLNHRSSHPWVVAGIGGALLCPAVALMMLGAHA
ncbi:MAG: hypothetical protein NVS4B2_35960 [Chloroflexota bacterium]